MKGTDGEASTPAETAVLWREQVGYCGSSSPRRSGTVSSEPRCDLISLLPLGCGSYWQILALPDHVGAPRCPEWGLLPTQDNVQNHVTAPRIRIISFFLSDVFVVMAIIVYFCCGFIFPSVWLFLQGGDK